MPGYKRLMARYRITIEYDGRGFVGWQRQKNGLGVQQALEEAIKGFSGEEVILFGAGRTDSGVHAQAQVAHFDLKREQRAGTVRDAINFHLKPHPVSVLVAAPVEDGFDARLSAKSRSYRYLILNRRAPLTFGRGLMWRVAAALDADAMNEAAKVLLGRHDFSTFRAVKCQALSPVKTLDRLEVARGGDMITITARARSFMHHQVRNMAGTLKLVGEGKWTAADVLSALQAKDRTKGGPTAPADGLYLTKVDY